MRFLRPTNETYFSPVDNSAHPTWLTPSYASPVLSICLLLDLAYLSADEDEIHSKCLSPEPYDYGFRAHRPFYPSHAPLLSSGFYFS